MPKETIKKQKKAKHISNYTAEFYSDLSKSDMLYASLIRSPAPHGIITDISVPDLPEGYFLFTSHDIPGKNYLQTLNTTTPIFCTEKVSYLGEPIGIIVGPDENIVYDITTKIEITFDNSTLDSALNSISKGYTRPVISLTKEKTYNNDIAEIAKALEIDAPILKNDLQKNYLNNINTKNEHTIIAERSVKTGLFLSKKKSDKDALFTKSDFVISGSWQQKVTQPSWPETNGAFCFIENEILNVLSPTHWPGYLRNAVAQVLNINEENIIVKETNTTGHDVDGTWRSATLAIQVALATYLTKKPVKIVLSREEHETFMKSGVPAIITCKSAVSKDGIINATHIFIDVDVGSYNPFAQEILDRLVIAVCNLYTIKNIYITAKATTSQNPPTSVFTETIDAQSFFAIENHIQQIAEEINIMPFEIREKNICFAEKENIMPFSFNVSNYKAVFDNILDTSDFNRKYTSFKIYSKSNFNTNTTFFDLPTRGIGVACAFDGAGYLNNDLFANKQKISLTLEKNENVTIHSHIPSLSISEIWIKTVSSILQIPPSSVKISTEQREDSELPTPDNIYGSLSIMTQLLSQCCTELLRKQKAKVKLPITVKKGLTASMKKIWNKSKFRGTPFYTSSFGCAVIEIELDPYTYKERIKNVYIAIDCGKVFSLRAAENTIRLAIQQELIQLVKNETIICDNVKISFIQSDLPPAQIGNIVHSIIPAAFSSALSQAIGHHINELPCSAEIISSALNNFTGDE